MESPTISTSGSFSCASAINLLCYITHTDINYIHILYRFPDINITKLTLIERSGSQIISYHYNLAFTIKQWTLVMGKINLQFDSIVI